MDAKEKRKQYYLDNKERIKERNKQYYHDNKEVRQEYNRNYWSINGHMYIEQQKKTVDHKKVYLKYEEYHEEYNKKYSTGIHQKYVHKFYNLNIQDNVKKDIIVYFN